MAAKTKNVVNLEAVDRYCNAAAAGLGTTGAQRWMTRRLRAAVLSADFLEPFTAMAAASRPGGPGGVSMADLRRMVATRWQKTASTVRSLGPA